MQLVRVFTLPGGKQIWREVRSTDGYMSVHPKMQHFGLGDVEFANIQVVWPNGEVTQLDKVNANQIKLITL
ncbi:ASPIC and UnbV [Pseudoalteromonas sp. P1-9]|uniref:ASPIC/UnbV domain-containing protein n=1 Tax=Pseudoalteromonas sp. P1-9 TaxID=1710354 RepID=UPI0006D5F692|nr:ASPIC/UnbV domain-containing protein [Pseudoalteromonas sp. P1-9]KPV96563.1 ASPIC and UnbV [Pseudoalteromonas sp. P1-9]